MTWRPATAEFPRSARASGRVAPVLLPDTDLTNCLLVSHKEAGHRDYESRRSATLERDALLTDGIHVVNRGQI